MSSRQILPTCLPLEVSLIVHHPIRNWCINNLLYSLLIFFVWNQKGQRVLIAAHGNSLRALVKYLDDMSDADIMALNIPTGLYHTHSTVSYPLVCIIPIGLYHTWADGGYVMAAVLMHQI